MVIRLYGAGLEGVDAFPVDVEVDLVRQGLPGFMRNVMITYWAKTR